MKTYKCSDKHSKGYGIPILAKILHFMDLFGVFQKVLSWCTTDREIRKRQVLMRFPANGTRCYL
jgi:hypothetical protein